MTTINITGNGIANLQAKARFGTNFLGAEVAKQIFDLEIEDSEIFKDEKVTEALIPLLGKHSFFTPAQLSAKAVVEKFNNQTLGKTKMLYSIDWYKNEPFFTTAIPSIGTRIISREPVEGSVGKNIFDCQYKLIDHAKKHLPLSVCSELFKQNLKQAEIELKDVDPKIRLLMENNDPLAVKKIAELMSCKMFMPEFCDSSQFIFVDNRMNNRRLFNSLRTWTKSITVVAARFVNFGDFDDYGARVSRYLPGYEWYSPSSFFSCVVEILFE